MAGTDYGVPFSKIHPIKIYIIYIKLQILCEKFLLMVGNLLIKM